MAIEMDDDDDLCFIYQDDPDCQSVTQLKDLHIGGQFAFKGEVYTKRNNYGWFIGVCNVVDAKGNVAHLHPTTTISLIQ